MHSRTHKSIADRSKGESLIARLENFEMRYAGQMGRIGRYSIHFHMIGSVKKSYCRAVSIHHTYNRAIAIHGVHYLRVQNNIAFETLGHTYFVEDGVETKNVITGNLGANTRELFVGLTSDATPATYWLVNGDNYVERNIAAGSTHCVLLALDPWTSGLSSCPLPPILAIPQVRALSLAFADGFWFFPEPKIRGASEFDPGCESICPQGVPLHHFADNEGHNNGRYGLRIFTGKSPHNGEGMAGFYPKEVDSCAVVSANNQFKTARFVRQYSWRNGKNGITVGSVAAINLVDPIVADNNMRGIELTGADGVIVGLGTETKLRGPWGMNRIMGALFVGHDLPCPDCDPSWAPNFPVKDAPLGWPTKVRLGLVQAASSGMTVDNATFINYDRTGMVAVAGFAKALPPHGAGYDFKNAGAQETRFSNITWLQSNYRVRWRWDDEALFTDLDGTFCEQPFCVGCHVLQNNRRSPQLKPFFRLPHPREARVHAHVVKADTDHLFAWRAPQLSAINSPSPTASKIHDMAAQFVSRITTSCKQASCLQIRFCSGVGNPTSACARARVLLAIVC